MDKLLAVFTHDNYLREAAGLRKYPLPKTIPINKEITSKVQAEKYSEEAHEEAKEIAKAAFDDNGQPHKATNNILETVATNDTDRPSRHTASLPPATRIETTATAISRPVRDSSPAFVLDTESSQVPLTVRTVGETPSGSFIVPTLATDVRNRQDTRNTVTFENRPTVDQRLMEIASSTTATTAPNHDDRHTSESQSTSAVQGQLKAIPTATTNTPRKNIETATTTVRAIKAISLQEHGKTATPTVRATVVEKKVTCRRTVPKLTYTVISAAPKPMIQWRVSQNQKPAHHWNHRVQATTTLLRPQGHIAPLFHQRIQTSRLSQTM